MSRSISGKRQESEARNCAWRESTMPVTLADSWPVPPVQREQSRRPFFFAPRQASALSGREPTSSLPPHRLRTPSRAFLVPNCDCSLHTTRRSLSATFLCKERRDSFFASSPLRDCDCSLESDDADHAQQGRYPLFFFPLSFSLPPLTFSFLSSLSKPSQKKLLHARVRSISSLGKS